MADDAVAVADAPSTPPIPVEEVSQVDEDTQAPPDDSGSASDSPPPDWSKALQAEQMKRANFEKKVDHQFGQLLEAINGIKGATTQVAATDELAEAEAAAAELENLTPGISKLVKPILAKLRAGGQPNKQDGEKLAKMEQQIEYERFFAGRPSEQRRDFEKALEEFRADGLQGAELTGAGKAWWKTYEKGLKAKGPAPKPAPAAGRSSTPNTGNRAVSDYAASVEADKKAAHAQGKSFYL